MTATQQSAMPRILAIPELFEAILLQLPRRTLLLSQRISHHFHITISRSPVLQQRLFFAATTSLTPIRPLFNPLLTSLFSVFFRLRNAKWDAMSASCVYVRGMHKYEWYTDETQRARVLNPVASWRRMYLVQPGVRLGKIALSGGCGCGGGEYEDAVLSDEVVKERLGGDAAGELNMGLLWDLVVYIDEEWPQVDLYLDWGEEFAPTVARIPAVPQPLEEPPFQSPVEVDGHDWDDVIAVDGPFSFGAEVEDDVRSVSEADDGILNVVKRDDVECLSRELRGLTLNIMHSQVCYSQRGVNVGDSGLRVGEGGFVGKEEVVKIIQTVTWGDV